MIDPAMQNNANPHDVANRQGFTRHPSPRLRGLGALRLLGALCCGVAVLAQPVAATQASAPETVAQAATAPEDVNVTATARNSALTMTRQLSAGSIVALNNRPQARGERPRWLSGAPWLIALVLAIGLVPAIRRPVAVWQRLRPESGREPPVCPQPVRAITPDMLEMNAPVALAIIPQSRSDQVAATRMVA